jgi:hypothetical protein
MFADLKARWAWRPIPNCPGRFVFAAGLSQIPPNGLLPSAIESREYTVAAASDPVVVAVFADGGLISYRKSNRTFLHTLNTIDGLERKLRELGIITPHS